MKLEKALSIIEGKKEGFRVSFEIVEGSFLRSDHFPENDEPLISTENEAWELAEKFARATFGRCVNIYVVNNDFSPVAGYKERMIKNR